MTKIYFTYRKVTDRNWNNYTPFHRLQNSFPERAGFIELVVEEVTVDKDSNWRPLTWELLGWINVDDTNLDPTKVTDVLKNKWVGAMMTYLTNDEAVAYMRDNALSNHPETATNSRKFKLRDITDIDWNITDTTYLEIN